MLSDVYMTFIDERTLKLDLYDKNNLQIYSRQESCLKPVYYI